MADTRVPEAPSVDLGDVLERVTDGFFALDAEWHITYINARARELLEAHDRPVLGMLFLDAFPRAREATFVHEYREALQDLRPRVFVEHSRTVDRWFEVQVYPSKNGLSVYFRDVSERVVADGEKLERTQRQEALIQFGRVALGRISLGRLMADALELLMDYLAIPYAEVYVWDPASRRYTFGEVAGLGVSVPPRDGPPLTEEALSALRGGSTLVAEDLAGDERVLDAAVMLRLGVNSALCVPVGGSEEPLALIGLYGGVAEITSESSRHFAEAVATTLGEAMRAKNIRRRNREILESINDAFVACDADLKITYVNERMAQFWQMRPEDIVGKPLAWFSRYGNGEEVVAQYRAALEAQKSSTFEAFFPERQHWFETRVYPYAGGVAGYVRDITRRKTAELQIRELNVELERRVRERTRQLEVANAELESFAYSVSHDLRAPLRAIDGFSQAIEEDYGGTFDESGKRHLSRVRAAAKRMGALIDALLDLAKVARKTMSYTEVDLSKVAGGIIDDLRRSWPEREVRAFIENGLTAYGEPTLIRACLENLLGNAWKFTLRSSPAEIHVGSSAPGTFFVRDNGAGFDMAYSSKLFGAFQRLHAPEEFEGTGVGLATVAKIVHRHGGTITGEGSVGQGATFTFTLPMEAPPAQ